MRLACAPNRLLRGLRAAARQRLALLALLLLLAVCSLPWRFCTSHYEYIIAEQLPAQLVESVPLADSPPPCGPASTLPAPVQIRREPATDAELAELPVSAQHGCTPRYRVAVIVPYRGRAGQLRILLRHLHPILCAQRLDYHIYVIEQTYRLPFNRGKLMNVGFALATADTAADCVVFHDVDLLPEDAGNVYACTRRPRHLSVRVSSLRYQLPYRTLAGGVLAVRAETFRRVNGYSNLYFGWGGEDDDLSMRLRAAGEQLIRPDPRVSRYVMLPHTQETPSSGRQGLMSTTMQRAATDGLSSLQYKVLARNKLRTHHLVTVEL